jgi:putative transposase
MKNWSSLIQAYAPSCGLTTKGLEYVLGVVSSPPSRSPSNRTGRNLLVDFASRKMGHTLSVESLTVEAAYAQMKEVDDLCMGYWSQPGAVLVPCTGRDGIKRNVWLTFDFLVFYADRIELVECKKEAELLRLSLELPGRFKRDEAGQWTSPEAEAALAKYGVKCCVKSDAELNPRLLRNYTLLEEARQKEYSSPAALDRILECFHSRGGHGVSLAELIGKAGNGFRKNDVYYGIMRGDLYVLLDECLLVDDRTTLVFSKAADAEIHRLIHFQSKPKTQKKLLLRTRDRLLWNGSEYAVCNAAKDKIYIQSKAGDPVSIPRELLCSLIESKEIELLDDASVPENSMEELKPFFRVLTAANQQRAMLRQRFLNFREKHPDARPEDFGLGTVSHRTIQRWRKSARESMSRFGTSFWGLLDKPRAGRPRDILPIELRAQMTAVANEFHFSKEVRSVCYSWRELRKRCEACGLTTPAKGTFRLHLQKMKNFKDAAESREGRGVAYQYGSYDTVGKNWITAGDFPLKVGQMDGKTFDVLVVDDETGEVLGRPTLTLITLPHYGGAPIGMAFMLEPESYRSATMALRDQMRRFGEPLKYLIIDNGKAFNNATFDQVNAMLETTKVNRPPRDPRFSCEIESVFRTLDVELVHNQAGNTKALMLARQMTKEVNPEGLAVWTFGALYEQVEKYLFNMWWDAPSASLGTDPLSAFKRDMKKSPDRDDRFILPEDQAQIAFLPEVDEGVRTIQPGRGVYVEGYYYWAREMGEPGVERQSVSVRYDPYDLYFVYAAINGKWVKCEARRAPELRNVTERTRHLQVIARRRLKNNHATRREQTHGRALADQAEQMRAEEKVLGEQRRAGAQRHALDQQVVHEAEPPKPTAGKSSAESMLPALDFSYLKKTT